MRFSSQPTRSSSKQGKAPARACARPLREVIEVRIWPRETTPFEGAAAPISFQSGLQPPAARSSLADSDARMALPEQRHRVGRRRTDDARLAPGVAHDG